MQKSSLELIKTSENSSSKSIIIKPDNIRDEKYEYMKSVQLEMYRPFAKTKGDFHFNLIESVNSNVKLGGIYNGSINIQFSPSMYIRPFEFLSIYANHQKKFIYSY